MSDKPTIRPAQRSGTLRSLPCALHIPVLIEIDLDAIVLLLKAGAIDQAGLSISATADKLERWMLFDDAVGESSTKTKGRTAPFVHSLLIVSPTGELAGMVMYYYNFSTWNAAPGFCLEELYVRPEYRGHNYARFLFEAMARRAQEDGCEKISWLCLANNERALRFYGKIGGAKMDNWCTLKLGQDGIDRLASESEGETSFTLY
jgi:GNAT superfamily N-acetyltransferase